MAELASPARKCPICSKAATAAFKPFCSKRCADVDLNRWLTGSYVISARDDEPLPDADGANYGDDEDNNI